MGDRDRRPARETMTSLRVGNLPFKTQAEVRNHVSSFKLWQEDVQPSHPVLSVFVCFLIIPKRKRLINLIELKF